MDGSVKRPNSNTTTAKAWDRVNNVVIGWLLSAMDDKIGNTFIYLKTGKKKFGKVEKLG